MILVRNAKLITMEDKDYPDGGEMLIGDDGTISAVGYNLPAGDAQVVDAAGCTVLPGIIDAHCHVGMWEDGIGWEGHDGNEMTHPITPELRAIDAINPVDRSFDEALQAGVTLAATGPGSANVIGGQFALMHTTPGPLAERVVDDCLALKVAFGENPKRVYQEQKKPPTTRMATAALMRQALLDAADYGKKMENPDPEKRPSRNLGKDTLVQALSGKLRVKAHAHRADDILTALRIGEEFGLSLSLEHCTEGYLIADTLKAAQDKQRLPVILGPLLSERSKVELKNLSYEAPAILHRAGVRFAMMTDHPVIPLMYLPVAVALAVRSGLPERTALASITLDAAWAVGQEDTYGSLKSGKVADFALYDGHPLDARTRVKAVYVKGKQVV